MSAEEFQLNNAPNDGISSICFGPNTANFLLVSSWDSCVRLYDVYVNQVRAQYTHKQAVLDCCFSDPVHSYSGGLDRALKGYDFNSSAETILGTHDEAIRCIVYSQETGLLATGSWDKTIKLWDPRAPNSFRGTFEQPGKVYTMDTTHRRLVVGTNGRHVYIYDLRNMNEILQKRESSLKFQTRAIRCFPNGEGYVLSSIEGRVAVEYFDPSPEVQAKKYAFKCHRAKVDSTENVYPVNAITFHPKHGTFATGGCDGVVNIWDGQNKKRLRQFPKYPSSVSSLSFSPDGKYLAVASSYTFEEGEKDHAPDSIFIRTIAESETKSKTAGN